MDTRAELHDRKANFTTKCKCGALVYVGTRIVWNHKLRRVIKCVSCWKRVPKQLRLFA